MKERFLPIGTVVMLKNGKKEVMITSYLVFSKEAVSKNEKIEMFEYGGCAYPEGILDSNSSLAFNHNQIDKIIHMGYINDRYKEVSKALNKEFNKVKEQVESGKI